MGGRTGCPIIGMLLDEGSTLTNLDVLSVGKHVSSAGPALTSSVT